MRNQQNEDLKNKEEDSEQSNWYELRLKPNPTDKLPNRWGHHASFIHEGRLYIFGGNDIKEGTMDSMWMINLAHFADLEKPDHMQNKICKWSEWETSGKHPGKVAYHTINVIGDTAYLIGGSNEVAENENVYTLYMNSFEWRVLNLVGESPGAIEQHTAVVYNKSIIVYGGYCLKGRHVWVLNTDEWSWTMKPVGDDPRRFP